MAIEQPEDVMDETGALSGYAGRHAGLRKVLTGKASSEEFDVTGKVLECGDVWPIRHVRESLAEHCDSGFPDFTGDDGVVSGLLEALLQSTDTRKKRRNAHLNHPVQRCPLFATD